MAPAQLDHLARLVSFLASHWGGQGGYYGTPDALVGKCRVVMVTPHAGGGGPGRSASRPPQAAPQQPVSVATSFLRHLQRTAWLPCRHGVALPPGQVHLASPRMLATLGTVGLAYLDAPACEQQMLEVRQWMNPDGHSGCTRMDLH